MKLEIRKVEKPDGDVYYTVYLNNTSQEAFYGGNIHLDDYRQTDEKAHLKARKLYEHMAIYASDIIKVTIIESTEI